MFKLIPTRGELVTSLKLFLVFRVFLWVYWWLMNSISGKDLSGQICIGNTALSADMDKVFQFIYQQKYLICTFDKLYTLILKDVVFFGVVPFIVIVLVVKLLKKHNQK